MPVARCSQPQASPFTSVVSALLLLLPLLLSALCCVAGAVDFKYHNQRRLEATLYDLQDRYPNLTYVYSIGKSVRGRDLWVIAIGKYATSHSPLVPNVKYIANMHGNEAVGREMLIHLAEHYLLSYGRNATLTEFLDTTRVHLMPSMNPDGFASSRKGGCTGVMGRSNAMGYDLNRNFPDYIVGNDVPEQKETSLVRRWIHETPFVLSANLHGGAMVANYPFDYSPADIYAQEYSRSPDDDVFIHLALTYSRTHPTMHLGSSCQDEFPDGIVNGANWYPVVGGMQDYMYRHASGYEVLVEMSCCKFPPPAQLERLWADNKDALINFLLQVHMGVRGIIYGQPADGESEYNLVEGATVTVKGREAVPFWSSRFGEYYKLLLPGDYVLQVSSPGYENVSSPFSVSDSGVTRLDIRLVRSSSPNTSYLDDSPDARSETGTTHDGRGISERDQSDSAGSSRPQFNEAGLGPRDTSEQTSDNNNNNNNNNRNELGENSADKLSATSHAVALSLLYCTICFFFHL
ncbi:carboxypeptidase M [Aplysia californica]|uniref:Carboxypeptidase M n=1 Tax=Aplysia californica TaxID=6500 RepID=A0ABM1W3C0_APLCA|nr:carboxypeptidase M [Aplysia californica]